MSKQILFLLVFILNLTLSLAETQIKIKATDQQRRRYDFLFTLTKKEVNRLDIRFEEILNDYRLKVRKEIALKRGYAEEVYGEDNYKYIELGDFFYLVFEDRFKRILYSNVNIRSVDDF